MEQWKGRVRGALGQDLTLALESLHSGGLQAVLSSDGWPRRVRCNGTTGS